MNGEGEQPALTLYIAAHCRGCDRALELASTAARDFPLWRVAVVDLDDPHAEAPAAVFGTPTWMANGRVAFLGNPSYDELATLLATTGPHPT